MRTVTWTVGGVDHVTSIANTATSTQVRQLIQGAIDTAESSAGGQPITVTLSAGTFTINGSGTPSQGGIHIGSNVTLQGSVDESGNKLTTVKLDNAYTDSDVTGIVRTDSAAGVHDSTIKDLIVVGNGQTSETNQKVDGIYCGYNPNGAHSASDAHTNITITNVDVSECSRYGVDPHEQTTNLTITNSASHGNGVDGFVLDYIEGGTLSTNTSYNNGRHGFNLVTGTHDILMTGNVAYGNGELTGDGDGIVIQPPSADTDSRALTSYNITITAGIVYGNADTGITINNGQHIVVEGVEIYDNKGNGVNVANQQRDSGEPSLPPSSDVSVIGNYVHGNGFWIDNGSEIRVDDDVSDASVIANRSDHPQGALDLLLGSAIGSLTLENNFYVDNHVDMSSDQNYTIADDPAVIGAVTLASLSNSANNSSYDTGRQYVLANGGNDTVSTGADKDSLFGHTGYDNLNGGADNDALSGGGGNDTLDGGTGADNMLGGQGDDVLIVDNAGDVVFEGMNAGIDLVQSSISYSIANSVGVENLTLTGSSNIDGTGNDGDNAVTGNGGINALSGAGGADVIWAGAGNDSLLGGDGADILNGYTGNDSILGGDGDDIISGGAGKDTISSNAGVDTMDYNATSESAAGTNRDIIYLFSGVDQIDLSDIDSNTGVSGLQDFTWKGTGAFTAAGQVRYEIQGANTIVMVNVDSNLGADMEIQLNGNLTLSAADFIL